MAHITMFNHIEDTEMAVDAGKVAQDGEDIDIDLEFTDDGHQDEMMIGDNHEPAYDMVLGDATAVLEQDEVMTDEGLEDQIFDEEIVDAPVDVIEAEELEFIPDFELEDETKFSANEPSIELAQQENFIAENTEVDAQATGVQLTSETLPATVNTDLEDYTAVHDSGNNTFISTKEEVEELITWESDEENEEDNPEQVKVGDNAELPQSTELAVAESEGTQESKTSEHILAAAEQSTDNTAESAYGADANENGDQHDADEQIIHDTNHEVATGDEYSLATDVQAVYQPDPEDDQREDHSNDAAIKEQALDQLHPIVIRYLEDEMSLFPPTVEEEHKFFFLSEKKLAFDSCANLFKAFREVLHNNILEDESLVLVCSDLGLHIHENVPEASTLSIAQLLHLHLGLSHNDGHDRPSPMRLELKHDYDVSGRLNQLYAFLNSGKGYSALSDYSKSEQAHGNERAAEVEEFCDEVYENDQQSAEEAQVIGLLSVDDHKIQNGLATPPHENNLEPEAEELDFQSPTSVQKNHIEKVDDAGAAAYATASEEDDTVAQHAELASASDVIDYDDEDDALEETLTNAEHTVNHSSGSPEVDLSQQATNIETHLAPSVTKDTDHSNANDGVAHMIDNELFHEETLNLENAVVDPKTQPANGKKVTEDLAAAISGNTPSNTNQEIPARQETSITVEEFEEIGYSDDDEPLPEPTKQTSEASQTSRIQSPKRSFEDLDGSDRDTKRIRSTVPQS